MSLKELGITPKEIKPQLVASTRLIVQKRAELVPAFDKLGKACKENTSGPPILVFHADTVDKGFDAEACIPIKRTVKTGEITSRTLEAVEALTLHHHGSQDTISETYQKIYGFMREHGIMGALTGREVFLEINPENPEENVTEVQVVLQNWHKRFLAGLEQVLGVEDRAKVLEGFDTLTFESSRAERFDWTAAALNRLDKIADEYQKYLILSPCAHDFPEASIAIVRAVFEETGDIDKVIEAMHADYTRFPRFTRKGNVLYSQKRPANPEELEKAKTDAERRRANCFCPLIRDNLDKISHTFCYCGSGWVRRLWEGILGEPVRVEIVKSLAKGDDTCQFAIHLPI